MEINQNTQRGKVKDFLKKYAYFFITFLCIALMALVVALTTNSNIQSGEVEVNAGAVEFTLPVANATIEQGYSGDSLVFNKTLKRWQAHKGICFRAVAGADVLSAYDGVVKSVYTNTLEGTVITIEHANGLQTKYGSLSSDTFVDVGDEVEKGEVIGQTAETASAEADHGAHVHFEVWKDGTKVDPAGYLNLEGK